MAIFLIHARWEQLGPLSDDRERPNVEGRVTRLFDEEPDPTTRTERFIHFILVAGSTGSDDRR
jgi:hypothetical protein